MFLRGHNPGFIEDILGFIKISFQGKNSNFQRMSLGAIIVSFQD